MRVIGDALEAKVHHLIGSLILRAICMNGAAGEVEVFAGRFALEIAYQVARGDLSGTTNELCCPFVRVWDLNGETKVLSQVRGRVSDAENVVGGLRGVFCCSSSVPATSRGASNSQSRRAARIM